MPLVREPQSTFVTGDALSCDNKAMDINIGEYNLLNLSCVNVILGKNGCGKSTLLKAVENQLSGDQLGSKKYVTPERGGTLTYDPNVEQSMAQNPNWMSNSRRVNQFIQFRQQTMSEFRRLEMSVYREAEAKGAVPKFAPYIAQINGLLDNIQIRSMDMTFAIFSKANGNQVDPGAISSGEAELISLSIELLAFATSLDSKKTNYLFLDSPDVHLHPDLQDRFMKFLTELVDKYGFTVILATHSTAILGGLADYDGASIAFMNTGAKSLAFEPINDIHRRVLPVFGAHPLSNVFNEAPVMLVEGDDDARIWQQAVRTSNGRISVYPVACMGVDAMHSHEAEVRRIVAAVYENARAFSLRDRDDVRETLADETPIVRMRLACRSAENLMLTDEVLSACDLDWDEAVGRLDSWLENNGSHERYPQMLAFRDGGYDRNGWDLKEIRMLLIGMILNSKKSWEVIIGQAIGRLKPTHEGVVVPEHSLSAYLGEKVVTNIVCGV